MTELVISWTCASLGSPEIPAGQQPRRVLPHSVRSRRLDAPRLPASFAGLYHVLTITPGSLSAALDSQQQAKIDRKPWTTGPYRSAMTGGLQLTWPLRSSICDSSRPISSFEVTRPVNAGFQPHREGPAPELNGQHGCASPPGLTSSAGPCFLPHQDSLADQLPRPGSASGTEVLRPFPDNDSLFHGRRNLLANTVPFCQGSLEELIGVEGSPSLSGTPCADSFGEQFPTQVASKIGGCKRSAADSAPILTPETEPPQMNKRSKAAGAAPRRRGRKPQAPTNYDQQLKQLLDNNVQLRLQLKMIESASQEAWRWLQHFQQRCVDACKQNEALREKLNTIKSQSEQSPVWRPQTRAESVIDSWGFGGASSSFLDEAPKLAYQAMARRQQTPATHLASASQSSSAGSLTEILGSSRAKPHEPLELGFPPIPPMASSPIMNSMFQTLPPLQTPPRPRMGMTAGPTLQSPLLNPSQGQVRRTAAGISPRLPAQPLRSIASMDTQPEAVIDRLAPDFTLF
ncbi:hypothetical protein WJX74_000203 [Apatococcus lobatus]|uniref:Uncharacterized protein n=1 Tax=Apatococcus lobatus TaxID=904363 RepID=A0AAW1S4Y2_9CHLO